MSAFRIAPVSCFIVLASALSGVAAFAQNTAGAESRAVARTPDAAAETRTTTSRPTPSSTSAGFAAAAERLRLATSSGAWRKPGWSDPVIESYLAALVDDAERLTGTTGLPRSPGLAGLVRHAGPNAMRGGELLVPGDVDVAHAKDAVFLAEGNIKVAHAHGCVVFALGDVSISHGSGNIVVAGGRVTIGFDGRKQDRMDPSEPLRSLIVAGRAVEISHARRSVVRAGDGLTMSHETDVLELGAKGLVVAGGPDSRPRKPFPEGMPTPVPRRVFAADLSGAP